jgi:hypothetical protein
MKDFFASFLGSLMMPFSTHKDSRKGSRADSSARQNDVRHFRDSEVDRCNKLLAIGDFTWAAQQLLEIIEPNIISSIINGIRFPITIR